VAGVVGVEETLPEYSERDLAVFPWQFAPPGLPRYA
jgi:hypothetical protein